jgi:phosphotransferase system HPr (HPr) family protein
MQSVEVVITNPSGLHARPAALFTRAAGRFGARITIENLDRGSGPVDAKSILLLLTAGVSHGHRIRIAAEGPDETEAIETLLEMLREGLGEGPAASAQAD